MATLTTIEEQVLLEVGETSSDPANWDGTDELRSGLVDALDELSMVKGFYREKVSVPLKANTAFYSVAMQNFWPLYITEAWLIEQNRKLKCESAPSLTAECPTWLLSRGSPFRYVPLSPELLVVWPCYSTDGGLVELTVVCAAKSYAAADLYLTFAEKVEQALVEYGKYVLLMQTARLEDALECFNNYLRLGGAAAQLADHQQIMNKRIVNNAR